MEQHYIQCICPFYYHSMLCFSHIAMFSWNVPYVQKSGPNTLHSSKEATHPFNPEYCKSHCNNSIYYFQASVKLQNLSCEQIHVSWPWSTCATFGGQWCSNIITLMRSNHTLYSWSQKLYLLATQVDKSGHNSAPHLQNHCTRISPHD